MQRPNQPAEATLLEYSLGGSDSPDEWGRLRIRVNNLLEFWISLSSSKMRELAIETLAQQGPYLSHTPPNQTMREVVYFNPRYGENKEPRYRHRQMVENALVQITEVRKGFGDDIFFSALQRLK